MYIINTLYEIFICINDLVLYPRKDLTKNYGTPGFIEVDGNLGVDFSKLF